MVHQLLVLLLFLFSGTLQAQDERYYRQILSGVLPQAFDESIKTEIPQFSVQGKQYQIDLNGDGIEETLIPQKRDGFDFLEIRDSTQRSIFLAKLSASGGNSWLYKIRMVPVTKNVRTLILFFDEGSTDSRKFESMARIYLLTFDVNKLSSMNLTDGPHYFHEKESQREQYWRRDYLVEVKDLDSDGTNEIVVKYHHIQRIMKYTDNGVWKRF